jgi:ferric-dicitrate binding protein FerR (iron transport regulator)
MLLAEAPDDLVAAKVCKEAPQLAEVARTQRNGRAAGIAAVLALAGAVCVAAISGGRHAERPAPSGASRGPITGVSCLPRDPSLLRGEVHSVEFWPQHPYYTACDSVILRKGDIFTVGATDPAQEYSVDPHVGWMTVHGTASVQKLARPEQFLHRYAPFGCLLAKIGDSEPITAGDGLVYQAEREGKLFLAVNERAAPNAWADNRTRTGRALIVKVTIQRAQPSG